MKNIIADGALLTPSKVVCIGRNYVDHIKELNNEIPEQAVIFVKPNSAICDEIFTDKVETIHYEAELSFMISNNKISAVGIGLDLTKRALQTKLKAKGLPWNAQNPLINRLYLASLSILMVILKSYLYSYLLMRS
ncbi:fumarylacetoacetate hydrolase family protein [Psychromonas sp. MME1]|uniref:fumarylacetoacetate hydrolase family protein n=1 Tax=Psychromonas sp. MME1 TaxID=3231032 RepID=UPI0034E1FF5A